ncbi:MAG: hypothetical protein COW66_05880 [Flavobacteriaceae bacterium CG18_big_fil_WC_8_21_14_2_50_34_36]|nr:MAG: hypothetical protein COW66_05880 [Flavobacteriaceae bacterium CG18_big_fil_WC_8_21_14_2_50_34_36]PIV49640.1 MAG: hypothetical protein COS19_07680 [Flavobacteriaceae bacterium CG02_land_8_20_14_3_00_34_13]
MKKLALLSIYLLLSLFVITSCSTDPVIIDDTTQEGIATNSQLANLLVRTSENSNNPNAITCINFQYPITFILLDANNQQTGTQTVNNDAELLLFLTTIDPNGSVSIVFPINVILADGTIVEVNNNQELLDIIAACDSNGGDVPGNFTDILTDGVWFVTYYFEDVDETDNFSGYEFSFATNNTAQATTSSTTINGTWNLTSSSTPDLVLYFGQASPLDNLDEDWQIIEATPLIIRLKNVSGGDGTTDFLTYERTPNTGGGSGGGSSELVNTLTTNSWYVNLLEEDGNNETCDYVAYQFTFNTNQTVVAVSTSNTVNGTWAVTTSSSGLDLEINFETVGENDPFEDLNDDWDVTAFSMENINLVDISGGNGGTDYLIFGRNPYTNCSGGGTGNAQELIDIIISGPWFVQSYVDSGNNETNNYTNYVLTFDANGSVVATNSTNTINGTWIVTTSSNDGLHLELYFGESSPFEDFNDDWNVSNYTTTLIELFDVSGGDGTTDTLTFQKL